MKIIYAAVVGALLGVSATLLHLLIFPIGLLFALIGSLIGIWALGRSWGHRKFKLIAAAAWIFVIVQGAYMGVGGELLIQGDLAGSLVILLGMLAIVIAVLLPI